MADTVTYEQLKEYADSLGYRLVKKDQKIRIAPCICGGKRSIHVWYIGSGDGKRFCRCDKCDLTGPVAKTEMAAKIEWNKMIESQKIEDVENEPTD